jgi:penicillin-binding protein 1C
VACPSAPDQDRAPKGLGSETPRGSAEPSSVSDPNLSGARSQEWAKSGRANVVYHHRCAALGGFVFGALAWIVVVALFDHALQTHLVERAPSKLIVDRRGEILGEVVGDEDAFGWWPVPYMLPERVAVATVETEDRHFYEHGGVRWQSIARAVEQNARARRIVSGASTIAMQVARMQSERSRGIVAKLEEAVEAHFLVDELGHDEVLRQYLALAPYGNRVHGVVRAARMYFDKPAEDLSWLQAAYLAALPQAPAHMNPWDKEGRKRGLARAKRILRTLHERGLINDRDFDVAMKSDLGIVEKKQRSPEAIHAALAWAKRVVDEKRTDVIQRATIDLEIQEKVTKIAKKNLDKVRERGATNTAAVVVDTKSGDVLAYVGSADYFDEDAHGAIDFLTVKRSPGSTLKPFIYGLALESGRYTPASALPDTPMDFITENGKSYLPKNINHSFLGPMLLREALANSRNIPALRVLDDVGIEPALDLFASGGVTDVSFEPGHYGLGLAIGNLHVTPLELASLYRALGNGGVSTPLRFFADDAAPREEHRILDDDVAGQLLDILSDPAARQPSFPPGSALDYDYAVATKTGTSQGYRDGWTAAVSDRIVVVSWVGNHDWRRMNQLGGLAGTAEAAHEMMDAVMPLREPWRQVTSTFAPPNGDRTKVVCALSGKLAGPDCPHKKAEHFKPGTEPFASCDMHVRARVDKRNGLLATSKCPPNVVVERPFVKLDKGYAPWAREQHMEMLPEDESPLCGGHPKLSDDVAVELIEPRAGVKYTWDPDTPPEFATIRLRADVEPRSEQVVFLVDGSPVAEVGYPHEARWTLTPGKHVIQAAFARRQEASAPVTITVRQ